VYASLGDDTLVAGSPSRKLEDITQGLRVPHRNDDPVCFSNGFSRINVIRGSGAAGITESVSVPTVLDIMLLPTSQRPYPHSPPACPEAIGRAPRRLVKIIPQLTHILGVEKFAEVGTGARQQR
jgi:hypothetical protein